jgi:dihydroneopterin aldolase
LGYIRRVFTVFVEGLDVYAYHGVPEAERTVGHRYGIEFELQVEGNADRSDEVSDTVDYAEAAQFVEKLTRESQFRTVERLATVLAESLLERYPLVLSASVTVRKPFPPAPVTASAVGSRVIRKRVTRLTS